MEKLLFFVLLLGLSKLVDLLKNSGQPAVGKPPAAPGNRPADPGKPGGLRGMLEELLRVPPDESDAPVAGSAVPNSSASPARAQNPATQSRPQRSRPAERSGGQRAEGQKSARRSARKSVGGTSLSSGSATGSAVARHVETAINAHVRQHVGSGISESVRHDIGEHVEAAFGRDIAGEAKKVSQAGGAASIRQILKSPRGVQQAMLVSEILNRPRIFRR
ncbi:hypothetical protein LBMAG46_01780 [Planctomycetia bacterium]|nr:hypothetical protein LBMAG46_01780 [Planctomycetia bacterium]